MRSGEMFFYGIDALNGLFLNLFIAGAYVNFSALLSSQPGG